MLFFLFYCCCATINMVNKDLQKRGLKQAQVKIAKKSNLWEKISLKDESP